MATLRAPQVVADAPTDGVELDGTTVGRVLDNHAAAYGPELRDSIVDGEQNALASHVDIYVDGTGVRRERGLATPVDGDSVIRIIPRLYQG